MSGAPVIRLVDERARFSQGGRTPGDRLREQPPLTRRLMPIGLLVPVVLVGWAAACALTSWRRLGAIARIPALVANELPFLAGYLLIASTGLALAQGNLDSVGGVVVGIAVIAVLLALAEIVRRALRADTALRNPTTARRPWHRILTAPLPAFRREVGRVGNLSYGEGPRRNLDVYFRRDRPTGVPVVLHFHGGGFHSGNKRREARPLIGHLVARGIVCASADYRLRPRVGYDEQLADALAAIEWTRAHAAEYGGDPDRIFLIGSSAGAYLAVDAVNNGASGIAGIVGRYGYYGNLGPERPQPPILVIHGQNDLLVPPSNARALVDRMRAASNQRVEYIELPGGHHDFDLYESIRANAVSVAVERFIALDRE
jgi:acetyl esterase/lipase